MPFTIVSFHAHPDDEALLTAGTLARAAAQGHRVVLVTATDGGAGLAAAHYGHGATLAEHRLAELRASAAAIGAARVEWLGYADSGLDGTEPDPAEGITFVHAPREQAAERLAAILVEEQADVLTGYDARGGYGHPDHVQVHHVARLAAQRAGTPVLLEATVPRESIRRALHLAGRLRLLPDELPPTSFDAAYSPRADLTHRVDVRRYTDAKRAAMRAHSSQAGGGSGDRTLAAFLRLPGPLYRLVLGREWFTEVGRPAADPLLDDVFASRR